MLKRLPRFHWMKAVYTLDQSLVHRRADRETNNPVSMSGNSNENQADHNSLTASILISGLYISCVCLAAAACRDLPVQRIHTHIW